MRSAVLTAAVVLGLVAGCSSTDAPEGPAPSSDAPAPVAESATPPPAEPRPRPEGGACYRLSFPEAVAPTNDSGTRPCGRRHSAQTFQVGRIDNVVGGHLLAVDSRRVQNRVADRCPDALSGFVGGTEAELRLSMIRAVWFTATVEESDAGADWYRCDAIVVSGDEQLAPLDGSLEEALSGDRGDRFGMCGTAAPGSSGFERVVCSSKHSWRAIEVVPLPDGSYPGEDTAKARGQEPCEAAGREQADDPLDFTWAYEWPDRSQWREGQTFGRCWAPSEQ